MEAVGLIAARFPDQNKTWNEPLSIVQLLRDTEKVLSIWFLEETTSVLVARPDCDIRWQNMRCRGGSGSVIECIDMSALGSAPVPPRRPCSLKAALHWTALSRGDLVATSFSHRSRGN